MSLLLKILAWRECILAKVGIKNLLSHSSFCLFTPSICLVSTNGMAELHLSANAEWKSLYIGSSSIGTYYSCLSLPTPAKKPNNNKPPKITNQQNKNKNQ